MFYSGTCYKWFQSGIEWSKARDRCKNAKDNGELASIPDKETNTFLVEEISPDPAWIGGYTREEGNWFWTDGSPWNYMNWATDDDQPNNKGTDGRGEGTFLMFNGNARMGLWYDDDGKWSVFENDVNSVKGYICQYKP